MIKNKLVKKSYNLLLYDFSALELWLSDMAKKGLILKKATLSKMFFEKTESQNVIYHIDDSIKGALSPTEEEIEFYNNSGWEYICTIKESFVNQGGYCHIYINNRVNNKNNSLIDNSFNRISERIFKKIQSNDLLRSLGPLTVIGCTIYTSQESLFRLVIKNDIVFLAIYMIFIFLSMLLLYILNFLSFKKTLYLSKLNVQSHLCNYVGLKNFIKIQKGILLILITLAICNELQPLYYNNHIQKVSPEILKEIEKQSQLQYDSNEYGNYFLMNKSLFSPVQYQISQTGIISNNMKWEEESNYTPSITIEYYELSFNFLAEPFVNELYKYNQNKSSIEEINSAKFQKVIFWENMLDDNYNQYLIIKKDNIIIFVKYLGREDIKNNVDIICDMFIK